MSDQRNIPAPQAAAPVKSGTQSVMDEVLTKLNAAKTARAADPRCAGIERAAACDTVEEACLTARAAGVELFQDVLGYNVLVRAVGLKNDRLAAALAERAAKNPSGDGLPFVRPEEEGSVPRRALSMAVGLRRGPDLVTALARLAPPTPDELATTITSSNHETFRALFPAFESCWRPDLGDAALAAAAQVMDYPSFIKLMAEPDVRAGALFAKEAWRLIVLHADSEGEKVNAWLKLHAREPGAKSVLDAVESCRPKRVPMDRAWFRGLIKSDRVDEIALERAWKTALDLGPALISYDTATVVTLRAKLWGELRAAGRVFDEESFTDLMDLLRTKFTNDF